MGKSPAKSPESPEYKDEKSDKVVRLAEAVLKLVAQSGTDGLTVTRLSRAAGVSRSWIYKYGGTQEELLAFTTDHFGKIFTSLERSSGQVSTEAEGRRLTTENFGTLLEHTARQPLVVLLYFRFRGTPTPIGKRIDRIEELQATQEVAQLQVLYKISQAQARRAAELIGSTRMGLAHAWAYGDLEELASFAEAKSHFQDAVCGILHGFGRLRP
jgi:AcrR family transcriptional regulator